jgi:hypothetical protein
MGGAYIHIRIWMPNMENVTIMFYYDWSKQGYLQNEASAREIETCKQNVGQKEDFMHSNFQMDTSLWIDAAFT